VNDLSAIQHFTSVDVETAQNELHSICEIGVARFRENDLVETWRVVLNPECEYETTYHTNIHGLRKRNTKNASTFPEIHSHLARLLNNEICIYHANSGFDPNCISRACKRYGLEDVTQRANWLSTHDIVRQAWPGESSHKLEDLCRKIGYEYEAHNALEDSMACAQLFLALSGNPLTCRIKPAGKAAENRPRTFRRVASSKRGTGLRENSEGPFSGTFMIYSGVFSPPWDDRTQLEELLCSLGFCPRNSFSKKTEILVTGEDAGPSKIQYANANGIRIMNEREFFEWVSTRTGVRYLSD
jgi:DNA polymerase-3 subunit epsilon